ncbi:MFS transporter [Streptosporangium sp. NPDC001681]|uniref:MFS transporter n=1 Tax=Streptosporangium sp. NPDC001681 TaxID=3154395 RepID=UPI00332FDD0A
MPELSSGVSRDGALRGRGSIVASLVAGQLISSTGSQMTWVALPWFVLVTTGSPVRAGAVVAAELLPIALFGIPAGRLVDRLGARGTLLLCEAARAPLVAAIPFLHVSGALSFPILLGMVFVLGMFFAPYYAAQRVAVAQVAGADERRVGVSNAFLQAAARLPVLVGSAAGGALIGLIGPLPVLYVNALTFLLSFVLVAVSLPPSPRSRPGEDRRATPLLAGLTAIAGHPLLRAVTLTGVLSELAFQALQVALPVLVISRYGEEPGLTGAFLAAWGAGALTGCLLAAAAILRVPARRLVAWGALAQSLPLWALPVTSSAGIAITVLALSGIANGMSVAPKTTLLTLGVEESVRAHTMSAYITALTLAGPLGVLLAGLGFASLGVEPVLGAIAALGTVAGLGLFAACRNT